MSYWITTHWPRRLDEPVGEPRYGVWVQDSKRQLIDRVSPGDLVLIYESRSGPTAIRNYADGSSHRIPCRRGGEGVVAMVRVIEAAQQPEDSEPEHYTDGSTMWWRYCAPTTSVNSAGFIPRV